MPKDLKILDAYNKTSPVRVERFSDKIQSEYTIESNYEEVDVNFEWLDLMEGTVRYLDNILRNPNRFIVNEEEVVKVEQSKRVTVESIKHLAKHTNFIQEIDKDGDVKPSKVLNINKDESFNTYENRVIYTLIQNMRIYVDNKKRNLVVSSSSKDVKKCEYSAVSRVGTENVNINLILNTKDNSSSGIALKDGMSVEQRIEKLEMRITDLTNTPVYRALAKEHVARVIPPVKKTNLILKNVNFQYAMKLWNFLATDLGEGSKNTKSRKIIKDDPEIKEMLDDVFLLNYIAVDSLSSGKKRELDKKVSPEVVETLTNKMIMKIVEINSDLPIEKITEIIGDKIAIIKNKREASIKEVEQKFNSRIQSKITKIIEFKFR